jgi:hypothetical protein
MTKKQAAAAYLKISKELERLQDAASAHISRADNNWVFERIYSFRNIAQRISLEYDVADYTPGGAHLTRAEARKQARDAAENRRNNDRGTLPAPAPGHDPRTGS